jgi:hypothetical protein
MSPTSCRCSTPRLTILGTPDHSVKRNVRARNAREATGHLAGPSPRTEVRPALVKMVGLPGRTTQRTVPGMFRRHRTDPNDDLATFAGAFHDRLAASSVTSRTDPPRIDPQDLRVRLGTPAAGLRERMHRRLQIA